MEKDTKRVWHLPYCFLEPGELERKFARLAAQGWLLEKGTYGPTAAVRRTSTNTACSTSTNRVTASVPTM